MVNNMFLKRKTFMSVLRLGFLKASITNKFLKHVSHLKYDENRNVKSSFQNAFKSEMIVCVRLSITVKSKNVIR